MGKTKYIFVSGGVLSGLGKGLITASTSLLLKNHGLKVTPIKCENYLNLDSGLINPIEHGDPFLCEDGTETDMDIGTYEKFLNEDLTKDSFITMGQIYKSVIDKERNFEYKGEDVEAVPHVTDEIINRIKKLALKNKSDVVVIELGGTVGEYQNALYYEASRIMKLRDKDTVIHIHVSYLPTPPHLGEPKTKPTQLSVKLLNGMGIQPDIIIARAVSYIDERRRERFALFCNVDPESIISAQDLKNIYELPLILEKQNFSNILLKKLKIKTKKLNITKWKKLVQLIKVPKKHQITLAIVGKYFSTGDYHLKDSYAALFDAINHASWSNNTTINIKEINSQKSPKEILKNLKEVDGIIVPIGWGERGVDGMLTAINFARTKKIPYLGLCFGMQLAVVEFARNVAGLAKAHTTEVDPKTKYPVIHIIPDQIRNLKSRAYGGTMRLGSWDCKVKENTLAYQCYRKTDISERHRHRYEFNQDYLEHLTSKGLIISGKSKKENLVEIIELSKKDHPFFIGTQGHPEYKSRPLNPHPIFLEFIKACIKNKKM
ncbi:MAG: CTP synthase [Candidatus Beckwithbacteria bacterium]|nr:CTP synthase [Patescibacteria group bacterium]